jgi:hypothetical protein
MLFKNNIESRRKKTALLLGKIGAVLSVPVIVYSFGTNPPLPNTGAPGEGTCASCHDSGQRHYDHVTSHHLHTGWPGRGHDGRYTRSSLRRNRRRMRL